MFFSHRRWSSRSTLSSAIHCRFSWKRGMVKDGERGFTTNPTPWKNNMEHWNRTNKKNMLKGRWPFKPPSEFPKTFSRKKKQHWHPFDFGERFSDGKDGWQNGIGEEIWLILLMEKKNLHHQGWWFSHDLQGFNHPGWCRISSINSTSLLFWYFWGAELEHLWEKNGGYLEDGLLSWSLQWWFGSPTSKSNRPWMGPGSKTTRSLGDVPRITMGHINHWTIHERSPSSK